MEEVQFKVRKMGCEACVARVITALKSVTGVEVVSVKPGLAVVRREPTTNDEQIVTAVKAAGYEATREVDHVSTAGHA